MDLGQIFALFFGPALVIPGLILRRAIGSFRMLGLLALCALAAGYAVGVEWMTGRFSIGMPLPGRTADASLRLFLPFAAGSVVLGAFGVLVTRFRAR